VYRDVHVCIYCVVYIYIVYRHTNTSYVFVHIFVIHTHTHTHTHTYKHTRIQKASTMYAPPVIFFFFSEISITLSSIIL